MLLTRSGLSKLKKELLVEEAGLLEESLAYTSTATGLRPSHQLKGSSAAIKIPWAFGSGSTTQLLGNFVIAAVSPVEDHVENMDLQQIEDLTVAEGPDASAVIATRTDSTARIAAPNALLEKLKEGRERRERRSRASTTSTITKVTHERGTQRRRSKTSTPALDDASPKCSTHILKNAYDQQSPDLETLPDLLSSLTSFPPHPGCGARGLAWTYSTGSLADERLIWTGIRLWDTPETYYAKSPSGPNSLASNPSTMSTEQEEEQHTFCPLDQPILLRPNDCQPRSNLYITRYSGIVTIIKPHFPPWPDMRADPTHPDFLPQSKLAAYQACEVAGHKVWRHDRDYFPCAKQGCPNLAPDFSPQTRVCIGCGPKSTIRFCSHQHELEAFPYHWRSCGSDELVAKQIIDHTTEPAYFKNMCPAIKSIQSRSSFYLHRQRHFICHSKGHYTLFMHPQAQGQTLYWPADDPKGGQMDRRVERLLNVAVFDPDRIDLVQYLYCVLRHLISISPLNSAQNLQLLKTQFAAEFGRRSFSITDVEPIYPCECVWYGSDMKANSHLETCLRDTPPKVEKFGGLAREVGQLERRYWILRTWAQQHRDIRDWKQRAQGMGYHVEEDDIRLGPGFTGWGSRASNSLG